MTSIRHSYIQMPAKDVARLAQNSLVEIKAIRTKRMAQALEVAKKTGMRRSWWRKLEPAFENEADAKKNSPLCHLAEQFGAGSEDVCESFIRMAEYLGPDGIIHVTVDDFESIMPLPADQLP